MQDTSSHIGSYIILALKEKLLIQSNYIFVYFKPLSALLKNLKCGAMLLNLLKSTVRVSLNQPTEKT